MKLRQRAEAVVEKFNDMREDLEKERKFMAVNGRSAKRRSYPLAGVGECLGSAAINRYRRDVALAFIGASVAILVDGRHCQETVGRGRLDGAGNFRSRRVRLTVWVRLPSGYRRGQRYQSPAKAPLSIRRRQSVRLRYYVQLRNKLPKIRIKAEFGTVDFDTEVDAAIAAQIALYGNEGDYINAPK